MGVIVVDLEAAGLKHAPKAGCDCNGVHDVDMLSVVSVEDRALTWADELSAGLQSVHEQAHPEGCVYWQNCREPGCLELSDALVWS